MDKIEVIKINEDMFTLRRYNGSSDNRQIKYNNTLYMVKYSKTKKNIIDKGDLTIHRQTAITEYIASKILKLYGLNTQEVEMGWDSEKNEYCVLCKDFNLDNNLILLNDETSRDIEEQKELRKSLNDLNLYLIPKLLDRYVKKGLDKNEFIDYWITLSVLDYLIGNRDRHLGNIGLIINGDKLDISKTFDNGACLGCHLHIEDDFSIDSELTNSMKYQILYENYSGISVNYNSVNEKKLPKEFYEKIKEIIGNDEEPKGLEIFDMVYNLSNLTMQQKAHILLAKKTYLFNFKVLKDNI